MGPKAHCAAVCASVARTRRLALAALVACGGDVGGRWWCSACAVCRPPVLPAACYLGDPERIVDEQHELTVTLTLGTFSKFN